jgi:glutaredoxin
MNDYIIFGLSTCIFCKKTIKFLQKKNFSYKFYSIDNYYNLFFEIFLKLALLKPNFNIDFSHKTIPVIFYKKKFIGGYTNLINDFNK